MGASGRKKERAGRGPTGPQKTLRLLRHHLRDLIAIGKQQEQVEIEKILNDLEKEVMELDACIRHLRGEGNAD